MPSLSLKRFNEIVGLIFASIMGIIIFMAILMSLYSLIFTDARSLGMHGARGNAYFYSE